MKSRIKINRNIVVGLIILVALVLPSFNFPLLNVLQSSPQQNHQSTQPAHQLSFQRLITQPSVQKIVPKPLIVLSTSSIIANGSSFSSALPITFTNGSGIIAKNASVSNYLDNSGNRNELFFTFDVASSGPISINVKTNLSVTNFQFTANLYNKPNGNIIASAQVGNPLQITYFVTPGTYYIYIFGIQVSLNPVAYAPFTMNLNLQQNTITPSNAVTNLFQSNAFVQVQNIFSFFSSSGYIANGSVDLTKGYGSYFGFDPTDPGFYKGIGLSIYGILRAGEFLSSKNNTVGTAKTNILIQYMNMTYQLFEIANNTNNIAVANGIDAVYVNPSTPTTASLTDNSYMLMGITEILNLATLESSIYQTNNTFIDNLAGWAVKLTQSIIDLFQQSPGVYVETVTNLNTTPVKGNLIYLESLSLLGTIFSWLPQIQLASVNQSTPVINSLNEFNTINSTIAADLLITSGSNTTITLFTGPGIGIGSEYYNLVSHLRSNTSTLAGNLDYALFLASWPGGTFSDTIAGITTNILRLFTDPGTNLLKEKALIYTSGTKLPVYISAIDNIQFILLSQLLQSLYYQANFHDASQTWGKKAITTYTDLTNLFYNNVDHAIFGLYDSQAQVLVSNDNNVTSNRFVTNAFLNAILVRLFPVQLNTKAGNNFVVTNYGQIFLDLSQIPQYESLTWHGPLVPFTFQFSVSIPQFSFSSTQYINLADFANFESFLPGSAGTSKFISIPYIPTQKGNYTIDISLSGEGINLLTQQISLTALGLITTQISPSILQVTQGILQPYSFSVTLLNHNQQPINDATIKYSIANVYGSNNTVFSNANGEATITLTTNDLLGLSNLAVIAQGNTNTSIILEVSHDTYTTVIVQNLITVLANSLKITANPVQLSATQSLPFVSSQISPIDVEVSVADSFGEPVPAEIYLAWNDSSLNSAMNITELGTHIAPYTFTIDPTNLPVGDHAFVIYATMDGITSTHQFSSSSSSKVPVISHPATLARKIVINPSTIQSAFLSLFGILSGFVMVYAYGMTQEKVLIYSKRRRYCPHCEEVITMDVAVCSHCGRDVSPGEPTSDKSEGIDETKKAVQEQSIQEEQNAKE